MQNDCKTIAKRRDFEAKTKLNRYEIERFFEQQHIYFFFRQSETIFEKLSLPWLFYTKKVLCPMRHKDSSAIVGNSETRTHLTTRPLRLNIPKILRHAKRRGGFFVCSAWKNVGASSMSHQQQMRRLLGSGMSYTHLLTVS